MPRSTGFDVMDVSTSICDDPKFRLLAREFPDQVGTAFTAYIAICAESWRAGYRVPQEIAWPAFLPFQEEAALALYRCGLIDKGGRITRKAWQSWFEPARERRDKARARWTRYNASRDADTASVPRGNDAGTATSVRPSVPTDPSVRPPAARGKTNGLKATTKEDVLNGLSELFKAGRLTEDEYEKRRREISA